MTLTLLALLIQSTVVLSAVLLIARLTKPDATALRIAIYRAGLGSVLGLAIFGPIAQSLVRPWWSIAPAAAPVQHPSYRPSEDRSFANFSLIEQRPPQHRATRSSMAEPPNSATHVEEPTTSFKPDASSIFVTGWIVGTLGFAAFTIMGIAWVAQLKGQSASVALQAVLQRISEARHLETPKLVVSDQIGGPFVAGFWRPTIYVPMNLESLFDGRQIEAILGHELAHVQQKDSRWAIVAKLVCALLWPNPLIWVLAKNLKSASEELCDQLVLEQGVTGAVYADCLLRIAERIVSTTAERHAGTGVFPSPTHLKRRISLVLESKGHPLLKLTRLAKIKTSALASAAVIGSLFLVSARGSASAASQIHPTPELVFAPTAQELHNAKVSGMPYIRGDFTLEYKIYTTNYKALADGRADHAQAVGRHTDDVILSCRKGKLLYKENNSRIALLDGKHVYLAWDKQGEVGNMVDPLTFMLMPIPAAGFAHIPISAQALAIHPGRNELPDLYVREAMGRRLPWENGLTAEFARAKGTVDVVRDQLGTRIVHTNIFGDETFFRGFKPLRGTLIATNYLTTRVGTPDGDPKRRASPAEEAEYSLTSMSPEPLPQSEFDPRSILDDKVVQVDLFPTVTQIRYDRFAGTLEHQALNSIHEQEVASAKEAKYEAEPVGGPDILPVFEAAKRQAKAEGKDVFPYSTSNHCAPCRMLEQFLEDPKIKPIMESRYVITKIHVFEPEGQRQTENTNGIKLINKLNLVMGTPSYGVMTPDGTMLENCHGIGFPTTPSDYQVFFRVLNAGPKKLTDQETATIKAYLLAHR
jgi:beta-lactamase regulating signal transducer with metallopeptidase domain